MSRIRGTPHGRIPASEESPVSNAGPRRACPNALQGELGEVAFMHKATSLGFALALPYGHLHRYDFILEAGRSLWRVQVKTSTFLVRGFYRLGVYNYNSRGAQAYTASEIDFIALYIFPEKTWYILPVREILERRTLFFRPTGDPRTDPYACYREAWHLLREPDGLTFG
jgi:hypothetical protein